LLVVPFINLSIHHRL